MNIEGDRWHGRAVGVLAVTLLGVALVALSRLAMAADVAHPLSFPLASGVFLQLLALVFLLRNADEHAFWTSLPVVAIGTAGVAGYLFAFNGFDAQLARFGFRLTEFIHVHMSAGLALLLGGSATAIAARRTRHGFGTEVLLTSGLVTLLLIPGLFLWQYTVPSFLGGSALSHLLPVAEAFLLLVVAILQLLVGAIFRREGFDLRHRFLPVFAFAMLFAASLHLWLVLVAEEQASVRRQTEATAERLHSSLEEHMHVRLEALHRIADRLERDGFSNRELWMRDAQAYLDDFSSLSAIGWVTPDGRIKWAVNREARKYLEGELYAIDDARRRLLETARTTNRDTLTPPTQLRSGGFGQLIAIPMNEGDEFRGSLVVGLRFSDLLLQQVNNVAPNFAVTISVDGTEIFSRIHDSKRHPMSIMAGHEVAVERLDWHIVLWPEESFFDRNFLWLPGLLLVLGIISAMLFAFSLYQLEMQRRRTVSLHRSEERYRVVAEQTGAVVYDYDINSGHVEWAGAIPEVFGTRQEIFAAVDIAGWERRLHPEDAERALAALAHAQETLSRFQCEYRFRREDGRYVRILDRGVFIPGPDGAAVRLLGKMSDETARYDFEQQLRYLAHFDQQTGLRNRVWFMEEAVGHVESHEDPDRSVWFVFLDVDRFRAVNETLGHVVGDLLLEAVARRVETMLQGRGALARIGGDEFGVCLDEMAFDRAAVQAFCEELMEAFGNPFEIASHSLFVTLSVGVACFPGDGEDAQAAIRAAETAMFRAKQRGRNTWAFYEAAMSAGARENLEIANALRRALERQEFHLVFQPRFNLVSGRITGMEALLRWESPELGPVSPVTFIPVAEETGLIGPIGWFVVEAAVQAARNLGERLMKDRRIAINVSARQLVYGEFVNELVTRVTAAGASPNWFEVELTESLVMEDPERARDLFVQLHDAGFTISIDDFGTGYSSLSYLKNFPVDHLKIDRTFVMGLPESSDDASIVKTIISMGNGLGLKLIAEGIETEAQSAFLREAGCQEAQGYLFARPMRLEQLLALLD